jgi:ADP-heptose:LPS heptosyltransferase
MELLVNIQEAKRDLRFLFLFRPDDVQAAQNVAQALPVHSVLFPQYDTFHHFAAYIASARMLLSPDTSAIHIAAANRVPVLGLYPAVEWNYWRWRPVNTLSRTVRPQQGLVPDIGVPEVLQAFHELLEEIPEGDGPKRSKLGDPPAMTNTVGGF